MIMQIAFEANYESQASHGKIYNRISLHGWKFSVRRPQRSN